MVVLVAWFAMKLEMGWGRLEVTSLPILQYIMASLACQ